MRLDGRELSGHFEGLDDAGQLLLRLADGKLQTITAGDVFPVAERAAVVSLLPKAPKMPTPPKGRTD